MTVSTSVAAKSNLKSDDVVATFLSEDMQRKVKSPRLEMP